TRIAPASGAHAARNSYAALVAKRRIRFVASSLIRSLCGRVTARKHGPQKTSAGLGQFQLKILDIICADLLRHLTMESIGPPKRDFVHSWHRSGGIEAET